MVPSALTLTGCTGFLGKLVLYDHLCTGVYSVIFVLLRPSASKTVCERWEGVCCTLRSWGIADQQLSVVIPMTSKLDEQKLGLEPGQWKMMTARTTHVVHCAASVSFTSPIQVAAAINMRACVNIGAFAASCRHLRQWVHVSTAYVASMDDAGTGLVPTGMSGGPFRILASIEDGTFDDTMFRRAKGHHFNTYTWTKNVAEHIVHNIAERWSLPLTIVRPSIIGPSMSRPRPGWVDSVNAITGIFTLIGLGCVQVIYDPHVASLNVIPVDMVSRVITDITAGGVASGTRIVNATVAASSELRDQSENVGMARSRFRLVDTGLSPCNVTVYTSWYWIARLHSFAVEDLPWMVYSVCNTRASRIISAARSVRTNVLNTYARHAWRFHSTQELDTTAYVKLILDGSRALIWRDSGPNRVVIGGSDHRVSNPVGDISAVFRLSMIMVSLLVTGTLCMFLVTDPTVVVASLAGAVVCGTLYCGGVGAATMYVAAYTVRKVTNRIFNRVIVDAESFTVLEDCTTPLLLACSHRSFLDFLLIPYLVHLVTGGHVRIGVVAADSFRNTPIVGRVLQWCGARYIKRGHQGASDRQALSEIIREYQSPRQCLVFFPEGTRVRDRNCETPLKTGVLKAVCAEWCTTDSDVFTILPVVVSYEKIIEQREFASDTERGSYTPRTAYSLRDLARVMRDIVTGRLCLGNVMITAGTGIRVTRCCDTNRVASDIGQSLRENTMFTDYHLQTAPSSIQSNLQRSCSDKMFDSGTDEIAGPREHRMLTNHWQHHAASVQENDST